jgi:hypothetical protein
VSSRWSLSLRFSHQNPVYTSSRPRTCYMPHPTNYSPFAHPKTQKFWVKITIH